MILLLRYVLIISVYFGNCLSASHTGENSNPGYTIIEDRCKTPILTSSLQERKTLKIRLSNGLQAYIISDPEASDAGALLTVGVGSREDPDEFPGLAHFLEHMLFLGTKKYPIESDYRRFISENGGETNAYTAYSHTCYFFSVHPSAFEEASDRFASFFKEPLFNPSGIERELHAVEQEFRALFYNDEAKRHHVVKESANPEHPYNRFLTGNLETLSGISPAILKNWYLKYYGAEKLKVIVYGPGSVNDLTNLVVEKFSNIATSSEENHPYIGSIFSPRGNTITYIQSENDTDILDLTWQIPAKFSGEDSSFPLCLIEAILNHEGSGSLCAYLRKNDWAEDIRCGSEMPDRNHLLVNLSIALTKKGLEEFEQVLKCCFQAIELLKQENVPEYFFEELKRSRLLFYQHQPRISAFEFLSECGKLLGSDNIHSFPEQSSLIERIDSEEIKECASFLTPENALLSIATKNPRIILDRRETRMGTPYTQVPFDFESIFDRQAVFLNPELHFPEPNPFMTYESLPRPADKLPVPLLLVDHPKIKAYLAEDTYFRTPFTRWFIDIKTPSIDMNDSTKAVMAAIYLECLRDALRPHVYPAGLAALDYDIGYSRNEIFLIVAGYHQNIEVLFEIILSRLKNCIPSESRFLHFKQICLQNYMRLENEKDPFSNGSNILNEILWESSPPPPAALMEALEDVSYEAFLDYQNGLYDSTFIEAFFYGKVEATQSMRAIEKLEEVLNGKPYPPEERMPPGVVILPDNPVRTEKSFETPSNATILILEDSNFSYKKEACRLVLTQTLNNAFFRSLRTEQQTGYLVDAQTLKIKRCLFSIFSVQSSTHDPEDLLSRFELFIDSFRENMKETELTPDAFENIRKSLISEQEAFPKNAREAGFLLKNLAFEENGDFDLQKKILQALKELSYDELLNFSQSFPGPENRKRLAVFVRGSSDKNSFSGTFQTIEEIKKTSRYSNRFTNEEEIDKEKE